MDQLESAVGPEASAESRLRHRELLATLARRLAHCSQADAPAETAFLDRLLPGELRRLLTFGPPAPGFTEMLVEALNRAEQRVRRGVSSDPREYYERLLRELRESG